MSWDGSKFTASVLFLVGVELAEQPRGERLAAGRRLGLAAR